MNSTKSTVNVRKVEELLETAIQTILSGNVRDDILRTHVREYAHTAGIPYDLACINISLHVKARIQAQLGKL